MPRASCTTTIRAGRPIDVLSPRLCRTFCPSGLRACWIHWLTAFAEGFPRGPVFSGCRMGTWRYRKASVQWDLRPRTYAAPDRIVFDSDATLPYSATSSVKNWSSKRTPSSEQE